MTYDFIIAGAGCAGLSLAYQLSQSRFKDASVLILDKNLTKTNDRTWAFWTDQSFYFDEIVSRSWDKLRFVHPDFDKTYKLGQFRYKVIRSLDFYHFCLEKLHKLPNFHFQEAEISHFESAPDGAVLVSKSEKKYRAKWLFNSVLGVSDFKNKPYLLQHFRGWFLKTAAPSFDPNTPTLFDFRTPQNKEVRFFYLLPFSDSEALVEYTIFSKAKLPRLADYEKVLQSYVEERLGLKEFDITEKEVGVIPMTTYRFPRRGAAHVLNIGIAGGMAKPSTGYTFLNIQRDTALIVRQLEKSGTPFHQKNTAARFRLYDAMILDIMQKDGGRIADIFAQLFENNPTERLLRFLDAQTQFDEELKVMASVPSLPFLKALWAQV